MSELSTFNAYVFVVLGLCVLSAICALFCTKCSKKAPKDYLDSEVPSPPTNHHPSPRRTSQYCEVVPISSDKPVCKQQVQYVEINFDNTPGSENNSISELAQQRQQQRQQQMKQGLMTQTQLQQPPQQQHQHFQRQNQQPFQQLQQDNNEYLNVAELNPRKMKTKSQIFPMKPPNPPYRTSPLLKKPKESNHTDPSNHQNFNISQTFRPFKYEEASTRQNRNAKVYSTVSYAQLNKPPKVPPEYANVEEMKY